MKFGSGSDKNHTSTVIAGLTCRLVVSRRAKRLRLTVTADQTVRLTRPPFVSRRAAEDFLRQKHSWVYQQLAELKQRSNRQPDLTTREPEHFLQYYSQALKVISEKVEFWNRYYGFDYSRLKVKNPRSIWGSCSSQGNLSFSYKIFFLPESLQDYIVVHELCHLKELNHSDRFWRLVEQTMPDYLQRRRELRSRLKR